MGNFLSELLNKEEDFQGLTEDEARQVHQEIKKEYSHPAWSSLIVHQTSRKWNNLARKSVRKYRSGSGNKNTEPQSGEENESGENDSREGKEMGERETGEKSKESCDSDSEEKEEDEDNDKTREDEEDMDVMVEINGAIINKRLLKRVIQKWESLDSEKGGSIEETDNVCNTLEELREESGTGSSEIAKIKEKVSVSFCR